MRQNAGAEWPADLWSLSVALDGCSADFGAVEMERRRSFVHGDYFVDRCSMEERRCVTAGGIALKQRPDVGVDGGFGFFVEIAGAFVEQTIFSSGSSRLRSACAMATLTLAAGEILSVFAGAGLIAVLESHDLIVDAGELRSADNLGERCGGRRSVRACPGLQTHGAAEQVTQAGSRTAVNRAGVEVADVSRRQVLLGARYCRQRILLMRRACCLRMHRFCGIPRGFTCMRLRLR